MSGCKNGSKKCSKKGFKRKHAHIVAAALRDVSESARLRFEVEVLAIGRRYETACRKRQPPGEARKEIDTIYRTSARVTDRNRLRLIQQLECLSDAALLRFGIPPDERGFTDPEHLAGRLNQLLHRLRGNDRILETFADNHKWTWDALNAVDRSSGGKPRDAETRTLVFGLLDAYRRATGREPRYGWNDVVEEYTSEFSQIVMRTGGHLRPPISKHKANDYIREVIRGDREVEDMSPEDVADLFGDRTSN